MNVKRFLDILGADFYTGVPDSLLKPLCDCLELTYGSDHLHHLIAANEGNSAALAAGYHLATGKVPVVYMQNSGEGNIINPAASLLSDEVYGIPVLFIIGWRGEPDVHDEPQHIYQGKVTLKLLEVMDIEYFVLDKDTSEEQLKDAVDGFSEVFAKGRQAAIVVRKGALEADEKVNYSNSCTMLREDIIRHIIAVTDDAPVVSTTGKASRELFELRESMGQGHERDFLTVGSMGHSSSIALGAALHSPNKRFWCIDGDGAALMHMGAMAVIGTTAPPNMVHIVINNGSHETVGGMKTAASKLEISAVAKACGYPYAVTVESFEELDSALADAKSRNELSFIEVKCAVGARADLGRPTTTAKDNKKGFMELLGK